MSKPLIDESPMPWGKYKGFKMCKVPASQLIWIYENKIGTDDVRQYIEKNIVEIIKRNNQ
jgi:uncharacterized protein (DUF3820 family)